MGWGPSSSTPLFFFFLLSATPMGTVLSSSHGDDTVTEIHLSPGTRLRLATGLALLGKKSTEPHRSKGPLGNTGWATRESKTLDFRCQSLVSSLLFFEITNKALEAALHGVCIQMYLKFRKQGSVHFFLDKVPPSCSLKLYYFCNPHFLSPPQFPVLPDSP